MIKHSGADADIQVQLAAELTRGASASQTCLSWRVNIILTVTSATFWIRVCPVTSCRHVSIASVCIRRSIDVQAYDGAVMITA
jgi:hypothetical protein